MKPALLFLLLWLPVAPAFAISSAKLIEQIPDGFREGRPDAVYGGYTSVVKPEARALQAKADFLKQKVFGIAKLAGKDPVLQAPLYYALEAEVLRFMIDVDEAGITDQFSRRVLEENGRQLYAHLAGQRDRLFEDMVRFIDVKIPGPNGGQFRVDRPGELPAYLPNYRSDSLLDAAAREKEYQKKLQEFLQKGGSLSEMKPLSKHLIDAGGPVQWYEFAERLNGEIWVTKGKAGHILLGEGRAVSASGQMMFLKRKDGEIALAALTNASGSYKPDMVSVIKSGEKASDLLKFPERHIVYMSGEPFTSQVFRIYMKGKGYDKAKIERRARELEAEGQKILERSAQLSCPRNFGLLQATP